MSEDSLLARVTAAAEAPPRGNDSGRFLLQRLIAATGAFPNRSRRSLPVGGTFCGMRTVIVGVWGAQPLGATKQKTGLTGRPIRTLLSDNILQDVTCPTQNLLYFGD